MIVGNLEHYEHVELFLCGKCANDVDNNIMYLDNNCDVCKYSFNNLDHDQHILLYWHSKLDHTRFKQLEGL